MSNQIALTISAHDQEVIRALSRTAEGVDKVVNRIERLEQSSAKQTRGAVSDLGKMAAKYLSVGAAVAVVKGELERMVQINQDLRQSVEANSLSMDQMARKFRVQAGLSALEGERAKQSITRIAVANSVTPEQAFATAQQLASSGFSAEAAQGGALDVTLKGLSASNIADGNPTQLVQAAGQFLESTGQAKTVENLRKALIAVQRLFKGTDVQLADLTQLASKSSGIAERIAPEEILAGFSVVRETTTAEKASTGLKIFGERLMGALGDPEREKALGRMGLTPEQVDFVGEDLQQVLDTLGGALDALPEEERAPALQKLFGTEASSPVATLIRNRGKLGDRIAMQGDEAAFLEDAAVAQSGLAAGQRRLEAEAQVRQAEQLAQMEGGIEQFQIGGTAGIGGRTLTIAKTMGTFEQNRQAAIEEAIAQGMSPVQAEYKAQWADWAKNWGASTQDAIAQGFGTGTGLGGLTVTDPRFVANVQARVARSMAADQDVPLEFFTPQARETRFEAEQDLSQLEGAAAAGRGLGRSRAQLSSLEAAAESFPPAERAQFEARLEALTEALKANTAATKEDAKAVKESGKKGSTRPTTRLSRE